jgi:hypothetical protein
VAWSSSRKQLSRPWRRLVQNIARRAAAVDNDKPTTFAELAGPIILQRGHCSSGALTLGLAGLDIGATRFSIVRIAYKLPSLKAESGVDRS